MTQINVINAGKRIGKAFCKSIVYSVFFSTLFFSLNAICVKNFKYFPLDFDLLSDNDGFPISDEEFIFCESHPTLFCFIFATVIMLSLIHLIKLIKNKTTSKIKCVMLIFSIIINLIAMILYMLVAIEGREFLFHQSKVSDIPLESIIILPILLFGSLFFALLTENKVINLITHNVYLLIITRFNVMYSLYYIIDSLLCKRGRITYLGKRAIDYNSILPERDDYIAFVIAAFIIFVICVSFISLAKNKISIKKKINLIDLIFKVIFLITNVLVWISVNYYIYDHYSC